MRFDETALLGLAVLLGVFFFVRAGTNLARISARATPLAALLNVVLFVAGGGLIFAPAYGVPETLGASMVVLGVFAVCTLIGRRPGDKVLTGSGEPA